MKKMNECKTVSRFPQVIIYLPKVFRAVDLRIKVGLDGWDEQLGKDRGT